MGIIDFAIKALKPESVSRLASTIPIGLQGYTAMPPINYERMSREGYMRDELVYSCIEVKATSAAEPRLVVFKHREQHDESPILNLLNEPNPFMDAFSFWASIVMYLDIAGNAYIHKVRSRAGKLIELWLLRPDRVRVIPDDQQYVRAYTYEIGTQKFEIPKDDIIHFKTRHPLDDYYGLPPLFAIAARVDLDNWARDFVRAFFANAGVPAGLLNIKRAASMQDREMIRSRFRQEYGGPQGWHNLLVIDGSEAEYTVMGLPLGARGAAVGELDEMNEARICMAFGVPPSIISARVGMNSSSYANRKSDREIFWESTLAPLYQHLGRVITMGLRDELHQEGSTRIAFDMTSVQALAPFINETHQRYREDYRGGLITLQEARIAIGYEPEPKKGETFFDPSGGKDKLPRLSVPDQDVYPVRAPAMKSVNGASYE